METCSFEGQVHFLEACNMAYRKEAFEAIGGFDESYKGCGDWSEPDLSFRIRKAGKMLWFTPEARMYHFPSPTGPYKSIRRQSNIRLENYLRFARQWVKPCWQHSLYLNFLKGYYWCKSHSVI